MIKYCSRRLLERLILVFHQGRWKMCLLIFDIGSFVGALAGMQVMTMVEKNRTLYIPQYGIAASSLIVISLFVVAVTLVSSFLEKKNVKFWVALNVLFCVLLIAVTFLRCAPIHGVYSWLYDYKFVDVY